MLRSLKRTVSQWRPGESHWAWVCTLHQRDKRAGNASWKYFITFWNLLRGPPNRTMPSWPQKASITLLAYYLRHRSHGPCTRLTVSLCGPRYALRARGLLTLCALAGPWLSGCLCGGALDVFLGKEEALENQNMQIWILASVIVCVSGLQLPPP